MYGRISHTMVLLTALAVLVPLCSPMAGDVCPSDCCCGEMPCNRCEGCGCITSPPPVPASALTSAVRVEPGSAVDSAATLPCITQAAPKYPPRKALPTPGRTHSAQELYLLHSVLLN